MMGSQNHQPTTESFALAAQGHRTKHLTIGKGDKEDCGAITAKNLSTQRSNVGNPRQTSKLELFSPTK